MADAARSEECFIEVDARMRVMRRPGGSHSEVILRLLTAEQAAKSRKATR